MSVEVEYWNDVFRPLEKVQDAARGKTYTVFSDEELRGLTESMSWLKAAEKSFEFWNSKEDAVYDTR